MAELKTALKVTLKHEGGYVFDPDDTGGETYKGVARKSNHSWIGWKFIDKMKINNDFPECLNGNKAIDKAIFDLYESNYWDVISGDKIENQIIANKIFDIAVNMGAITSIRLVQLTLNVSVDGRVGSQTLNALNEVDFDLFMSGFRLIIISRYMAICKKRYKSRKFLYGWIKRALS